MEPESKGLELSGETDTQIHDADRISNLPEDLIGNILSLLPTKEAVATSVLSPQWKWSWTFINRLDFVDCLSFISLRNDVLELCKASFISFVNRVLFYRKPTPLNYMGFNCCREYCASHVVAWVSAVLSFGVKELDLSIPVRSGNIHVLPSNLFCCKSLVKLRILRWGFRIHVPPIVCLPSLQVLTLNAGYHDDDDSFIRFLNGCPSLEEFESNYPKAFILPLELFTSRKLRILKLCCRYFMNPPNLVSLPSLEALHLRGLRFRDNGSFTKFLRGCPSLKELNLTTYYTENVTGLHIDVPTLSDLTIYSEYPGVSYSKMVLDTPSLQYLKIDGATDFLAKSLEVTTDLSQLTEADISVVRLGMQYQVASNLILALSKVKTLHLCGNMIEVLTNYGCKLPKFDKMTTLNLGAPRTEVGWALLPHLLENSPVLETLVFREGIKGLYGSKDPTPTRHAHEKVPYCLTHHLKVIQVNKFEGDIEKEEMMKYFIENRGVSEDLTINTDVVPKAFGNCRSNKRLVKEL